MAGRLARRDRGRRHHADRRRRQLLRRRERLGRRRLGLLAVEPKPAWQAGTGSCATRSVVDVAADADPNTGAAVYDSVAYHGQSGWFQVGGTSLSSPLIASVYALADDTSTISNGRRPTRTAGRARSTT